MRLIVIACFVLAHCTIFCTNSDAGFFRNRAVVVNKTIVRGSATGHAIRQGNVFLDVGVGHGYGAQATFFRSFSPSYGYAFRGRSFAPSYLYDDVTVAQDFVPAPAMTYRAPSRTMFLDAGATCDSAGVQVGVQRSFGTYRAPCTPCDPYSGGVSGGGQGQIIESITQNPDGSKTIHRSIR